MCASFNEFPYDWVAHRDDLVSAGYYAQAILEEKNGKEAPR